MTRARLFVALGAGLVLVGAVVSLRGSSGVAPLPEPRPAPAVAAFIAPGVHVERIPGPPATPGDAEFVVGRDTPVLRWAPVPTATGYEVVWRAVTTDLAERDEQRRSTAVPAVALTGIPARASVSVRVTAVDAAGRRSVPLRLATGSLTADPDDGGPAEFADPFFSAAAPDRYRWRLPEGGLSCLVRGGGADLGMLVVRHGCGTVQLRPAVPLRLSAPQDGERGRVTVSADGPDGGGELAVALLPGPHAGLPPGILDRAGPPPGTAGMDPALPGGAVLLRIGPRGPALSLSAPATAKAGPAPPALAEQPAVPHSWELRITPTGLAVLRDGARTLTAAVAVPWREATAVVAVRPGPDGAGRTLVDAVRMSAPPPPPEAVRVLPLSSSADIPATALTGATRLRLLGWLVRPPAGEQPTVTIGGSAAVLRPVGTPSADGTLAVTADLPVPDTARTATLRLSGPMTGALRDAVLEVTRRPALATEAAAPRLPLGRPPPAALAPPLLQVRAPGGGPVTVAVAVDGEPAQRRFGAPAGYVGIEAFLDGRRVAGVPTAASGPAVGGRYVLTLDPELLTRTAKLTVRVVPALRDVPAASTTVTLPGQ